MSVRGAGQPQIFVDDHHLSLGQPSWVSPIGQGVLAGGGLAIVFDLARRGLANVNVSGALGVEGLILEGSVIGLLQPLARVALTRRRESLDDEALLLVVELLPQVRLRNRDPLKFRFSCGMALQDTPPILRAKWPSGAGEHRSDREAAGGRPESRRS